MRVILDTVVLVRALINPYGLWGRLIFEHGKRYDMVVSPPVVREYLDVIRRPELTRKYRNATTRNPHVMLDLLAQAEVVVVDHIPVVSRDPKDDPFLETARVGVVDYIVSEDRHLLDLVEHAGIPIITGDAFIAILDVAD